MPVYTVHEPPDPATGRIERAEALVFVRDGFSWGAALLPPVWLGLRGEWILLGVYVAAVIALSGILAAVGAHGDWAALAGGALNIFVGFEIHELRRALLRRRGWCEVGTVSGRTREECERRFFDFWLSEQPATVSHGVARAPEIRALAGGSIARRLRHGIERVRGFLGAKA